MKFLQLNSQCLGLDNLQEAVLLEEIFESIGKTEKLCEILAGVVNFLYGSWDSAVRVCDENTGIAEQCLQWLGSLFCLSDCLV